VYLQLNNPSTCAKRRYTHPAEALQLYSLYSSTALYSPLQSSTALYSPLRQPSTALQLYILYSIQPSTTPLWIPKSAKSRRDAFVKRTFARWRALPLRRDLTRFGMTPWGSCARELAPVCLCEVSLAVARGG
jgi:hypothetical protein